MASYRAAPYNYQYGRGRTDPISGDWNRISWAAFDAAWDPRRRIKNRLVFQWAEAEALLRCGWEPS
jgi:hypothetical protein